MLGLKELMQIHPAAKNVSNLLDNYEKMFSPLRDKEIVLLELGVYQGYSLKIWQDYFPLGKIIGIDNNRGNESYGRITEYSGGQDNTELLSRIASNHAPEGFDIIIDDCSHVGSLTKASFMHLFYNHLKSGGIYSIEDYGVSYEAGCWEGTPYAGVNHSSGIIGFVKDVIDQMITKWYGPVESLILQQENCFIIKR